MTVTPTTDEQAPTLDDQIARYAGEGRRLLDEALALVQWLPDIRGLHDDGEADRAALRVQTVAALAQLSQLSRDEADRLRRWRAYIRRQELTAQQGAGTPATR